MSDENTKPSNAELLYGNEGGSPAESGNIETALGGAFDQLEYQARYDGKKGLAAELAGVRKALHGNMTELGFSENAASEVATLIGEYHGSPRDAEQAEKNFDAALDKLADEWDADFPKMFEGAQKVLAELAKGNPSLTEFMHSTGLSREVRLLRLAGNIAKSRGMTK